jgi:hypothetical protein
VTTAGAVSAEDAGPLMRFLRWCGLALVAAGALMVVATLLHPSRETASTIVASEPWLVAAHVVYTLAWLLLLLGLPGLYAVKASQGNWQASRLNRLAPCCSHDRHDAEGP